MNKELWPKNGGSWVRIWNPKVITFFGVLGLTIVSAVAVWVSVSNALLPLALIVFAGCLLLSIISPSGFFCLFLAVVILIPPTVGVRISGSLPIIFPYRVLIPIGLTTLLKPFTKASRAQHNAVSTDAISRSLLLFFIVMAATVYISIDYASSIMNWFWSLTVWAGTYYLARITARRGYIKVILWTLVCITVIVGLVTVLESMTNIQVEEIVSTGYLEIDWTLAQPVRAGIKRIAATLGHPVILGEYFAISLPLLLALRSRVRSRRLQLGLAFVILLSIAGMLLTGSTGPLLLTGAAVSLWFVLTEGLQGWRKVGVIMALFLGVSIVAQVSANETLQSLTIGKFDPNSVYFESVSSRLEGFAAMTRVAMYRPILGFGLNTWNLVLPRNAYSHMFNFDFISPGNEVFYGSRVLETGLLGLITTLVVFATVLRTIYKAYRTAPEPTRGIMAALFAINASLVVAGLGESPLLFTPIAVLFWTFAGLATAVREQPLMRFLNSKRTLKNSK